MRRSSSRVTSIDVAREAGVSQSTVSFVLNNTRGQTIPEETRRRVLEAAKKLDYRPRASARSLAAGRSDVVLLALPGLPISANLSRFIEQLAAALAEHGLSLVTHLAEGHGRPLPDLCAAVDASAVISLIPFDEETTEALHRAGAEVVLGTGSPGQSRIAGDRPAPGAAPHRPGPQPPRLRPAGGARDAIPGAGAAARRRRRVRGTRAGRARRAGSRDGRRQGRPGRGPVDRRVGDGGVRVQRRDRHGGAGRNAPAWSAGPGRYRGHRGRRHRRRAGEHPAAEHDRPRLRGNRPGTRAGHPGKPGRREAGPSGRPVPPRLVRRASA